MSQSGPLSISLSTSATKTAVPTIPADVLVPWRLEDIGLDSGEKGQTLKFKFSLTQPVATTDDGKLLSPGDFGSNFFLNIALYAKPDAKDPKWFEKKIAEVQDALLGTGDAGNAKGKPARPDFNNESAATMIGRVLVAKMRIKPDEFGGGNEFGRLYFPPDLEPKA